MAVESIGSSVGAQATTLQNAGLGQEDFLRILLTQLSFQDPLKPLDNQEFIAQMAQFTNLEVSRQQNDRLDTLLAMQTASQAIGLIGREVEIRTDSGDQSGTVERITFSQGSPNLSVKLGNGDFVIDVRLADVFRVK